MNPHAEDILRRAACGELAPNSDELRDLLAADPEARQRLEELSAVSRALALAGADERLAIEEARAATTERDRERVAAVLHAAAPSLRTTPWWMRRSLWLAAALVVGVALGALALRTPRGGQRTVLSTDGYECVEPVGQFDANTVFRWRGVRPTGGAFEVVVCAENADGTRGKVLLTSERCETNNWTAPRERLDALPESIVWYVRVYDGSGGGAAKQSPDARARRSPH